MATKRIYQHTATSTADLNDSMLVDSAANGTRSITLGDFVTSALSSTDAATLLIPGGRLTLTTAVPVTVTDVTAATAIYYTPYVHDRISIYDGSNWGVKQFAELTLTLNNPNHAANTPYDVFVFNDGGTIRIGTGPAWSSLTARGTGSGTTELEYVNGRLVNKIIMTVRNGASTYSVPARRGTFVGSFRTTATAGQTEDSNINRYISNAHNKVRRRGYAADTTSSWTYASATFREVRGSANRVTFFRCLDEDEVAARAHAQYYSGAASSIGGVITIGLDSTTAAATGATTCYMDAATHCPMNASYSGFPGLGSHYIAALEARNGSGTATFYGTGLFGQSQGLYVEIMA